MDEFGFQVFVVGDGHSEGDPRLLSLCLVKTYHFLLLLPVCVFFLRRCCLGWPDVSVLVSLGVALFADGTIFVILPPLVFQMTHIALISIMVHIHLKVEDHVVLIVDVEHLRI